MSWLTWRRLHLSHEEAIRVLNLTKSFGLSFINEQISANFSFWCPEASYFFSVLMDGVPFPFSHSVVTPISQWVSVPDHRQQDQATSLCLIYRLVADCITSVKLSFVPKHWSQFTKFLLHIHTKMIHIFLFSKSSLDLNNHIANMLLHWES